MKSSSEAQPTATNARRDTILDAAIREFGQRGYRKTSIEDLASAAQISKQGLYLHFAGKNEVFVAAMQKYLTDGLTLVDEALGRTDQPLSKRLAAAMDAWFGRHLVTFTPSAFDVIEAGDQLSSKEVDKVKLAFQQRIAKALASAPEFMAVPSNRSPQDVAQVLFLCGLTWKDGKPTPQEFSKRVRLCVRVCCHLEE